MEDKDIVELYWKRDDTALAETQKKYGKYCRYIAYNILQNNEDAEECENDTYVKAWSVIPPKCPSILSAFLAKITRNLALDKYRKQTAKKRGGTEYDLILDEVSECIPAKNTMEHIADDMTITSVLNQFLKSLSEKNRKIFMRRYWYMSPIKEIAIDFSLSESNVKMILLRTRNDLKTFLEKEGIDV